MKRREAVKTLSILGSSILLAPRFISAELLHQPLKLLEKGDFGKDFLWGVATAAYQIEGAHNIDGKSPSIWDTFAHKKGKIKTGENADITCDFYHRYEEDIQLIKKMNFKIFRFSIAWSRVLKNGTNEINQDGIDFYHKVIKTCFEHGVEPWITLYHWDLPQALEDKGGWANREVIKWFCDYVDIVTKEYGPYVKNWMMFNEPAAFTGLGYLTGTHAPGVKSVNKYFKTVHHTVLSTAEGARVVRKNIPDANIGTTFSMSSVMPKDDTEKNTKAAKTLDTILNRMFIEPAFGLGYPEKDFPMLKTIQKFKELGDDEKMQFDFDFVGVQNYFRVVAQHSLFPPVVWANQVKPHKLVKDKSELTEMGWEVYPKGIYDVIMKIAAYKKVPTIIVTENGCAYKDEVVDGVVKDDKRIAYFQNYLTFVKKAKEDGAPLKGYFVWSLMDNFEWAEGFHPRFGLVHVDFKTQKRTIKNSGLWFQKFLS